jgi:hypothetical protein
MQRLFLVFSIICLCAPTLPSHAFTPSPLNQQKGAMRPITTTSIDLFGLFGKDGDDKVKKVETKTTSKSKASKGGKKVEKEEEPKKKPYIFLYGKPQYDWVKAKPMDTVKPMGQYNWVTGKPNPDPKK